MWEQEALVPAHLTDFVKNDGIDDLIEYLLHCGIPFVVLAAADKRGLAPIILAHYRIKPGVYDIDRVAADMVRWPPIAEEIARLEKKKRLPGKLPINLGYTT